MYFRGIKRSLAFANCRINHLPVQGQKLQYARRQWYTASRVSGPDEQIIILRASSFPSIRIVIRDNDNCI